MICNMTSTIALLRMSKKKRQKTLSNQQQANRLKFVLPKKKNCQTCDPLTEIHNFDQKCHVLSKQVFCFCLTWPTDIRHFEKQTLLSSFQKLTDYASLEVKKTKTKNREAYVWVVTEATMLENIFPVPAKGFGKMLAEDNWFHFGSVLFHPVSSSWI